MLKTIIKHRSIIAASILKYRSVHNLIDVTGDSAGIKSEGIKVLNHICTNVLN